MDTIWVDALPADLVVRVLLRLGLQLGEIAKLSVEMLGPGMASLGSFDEAITAEPGPTHQEGYEVAQLEPVVFAFTAEKEGFYSAEIYSDGRHQEAVFLTVLVGEPPV